MQSALQSIITDLKIQLSRVEITVSNAFDSDGNPSIGIRGRHKPIDFDPFSYGTRFMIFGSLHNRKDKSIVSDISSIEEEDFKNLYVDLGIQTIVLDVIVTMNMGTYTIDKVVSRYDENGETKYILQVSSL